MHICYIQRKIIFIEFRHDFDSEWRAYGSYARPIYILGTSGLTIFTILWSVFSAVEQVCLLFLVRITPYQRQQQECAGDVNDDVTLSECFHTEYSGWVFRVITMICFLFLAIIQAAYGIKLYYLQDWQILGRLSTSKELLTTVNILVSLSFASRAVYQWIVMTFPQIHLPDVFLQVC